MLRAAGKRMNDSGSGFVKSQGKKRRRLYIPRLGGVPKLNIVGDPEADQLLQDSPFALLMAMLLDQQIPMERAFAGPKVILDRLQRVGTDQPVTIRWKYVGKEASCHRWRSHQYVQ